MNAERLGFASAILAASCCVLPLGLAALGLGSFGLGSALGIYHWHLITAAVGLLGIAWWSHLRATRRTIACSCDLERTSKTRTSLTAASLIVLTFVGLSLYTGFGHEVTAFSEDAAEVITLPVHGMSCSLCERPIESNLKKIDGVLDADASASESQVVVRVTRGAVRLDAIAGAVRAAGYEPEVSAAELRN